MRLPLLLGLAFFVCPLVRAQDYSAIVDKAQAQRNKWSQAAQKANGNAGGAQQWLGTKCGIPPAPGNASVDKNIHDARYKFRNGDLDLSIWWIAQVSPGGPWDYKRDDMPGFNKGFYRSKFDDLGNFNYGATGAALEWSKETLLCAAGFIQDPPGKNDPYEKGVARNFLNQKPEDWRSCEGTGWLQENNRAAVAIARGYDYYRSCYCPLHHADCQSGPLR